VILGKNVKIQNNVSVYEGVICEDDVFLGPSMVFTNVLNPRSAVNRRGQYSKTTVKKGASIGANATIVCGHDIGEFAFIGAGAANTTAILDGCATRPIAASVANSYTGSGYTDWYLPSKDELNSMWNNVGTGASFPNYNKANLSGYLWSSSQVDSTSAWMQLMDNGTQFQDSKAQVTQNKIRPVRSF
jgi:hypothetical protein